MILRTAISLRLLLFLLAGISPACGNLLTASETRTGVTGAKTANRTYDRQFRLASRTGANRHRP